MVSVYIAAVVVPKAEIGDRCASVRGATIRRAACLRWEFRSVSRGIRVSTARRIEACSRAPHAFARLSGYSEPKFQSIDRSGPFFFFFWLKIDRICDADQALFVSFLSLLGTLHTPLWGLLCHLCASCVLLLCFDRSVCVSLRVADSGLRCCAG